MGEVDVVGLTDAQVVARVTALCLQGARVNAEIVRYLVEVEDRRLHLRRACSSMFDFCVRRLKMSEGSAFRRINAARLVARFPVLLSSIAAGELHLSGLVLLRDVLTEANVDEVLAAARGKSVRELEAMLAVHAPKPDVRDRIRPLSESRFEVRFTVSREVRDKLERAQDLLAHRNPRRELAVVLESALDALLSKLEREILGKAERPRAEGASIEGSISRSARREVFARDGERCTFTDDETGDRCPAQSFLELDHVEARALGGEGTAPNLRVRCHAHNRLHAEQVYGRPQIEHAIIDADLRRRRPSSAPDAPDAPDAPHSPDAPDRALALAGLVKMGFQKKAVIRALDAVLSRHADVPPLPEVLREALGVLTP